MELKGFSRGSVVIRGPEHGGSGTDEKKLEQRSAQSLRSMQKLVNGCCIASARVFVPIGSRRIIHSINQGAANTKPENPLQAVLYRRQTSPTFKNIIGLGPTLNDSLGLKVNFSFNFKGAQVVVLGAGWLGLGSKDKNEHLLKFHCVFLKFNFSLNVKGEQAWWSDLDLGWIPETFNDSSDSMFVS